MLLDECAHKLFLYDLANVMQTCQSLRAECDNSPLDFTLISSPVRPYGGFASYSASVIFFVTVRIG